MMTFGFSQNLATNSATTSPLMVIPEFSCTNFEISTLGIHQDLTSVVDRVLNIVSFGQEHSVAHLGSHRKIQIENLTLERADQGRGLLRYFLMSLNAPSQSSSKKTNVLFLSILNNGIHLSLYLEKNLFSATILSFTCSIP